MSTLSLLVGNLGKYPLHARIIVNQCFPKIIDVLSTVKPEQWTQGDQFIFIVSVSN